MAPDPDRADLMAALAMEFAQLPTEETTATAVTERALMYIKDADAVSITLKASRHSFATLAATSELARDLDGLQYSLREGPCVAAADGNEWYRSGDVGGDDRWPRWGPRARDAGVHSLLSVRLISAGSSIGALNFYSLEFGRFSERDDIDFAIIYATHVALALASTRQVSGLETALHSRHIIGVAQGILCERFGLDLDRSFELLSRYSSTTNTKLSVVAEEIVRTRRLPESRSKASR